MDITNIKKVYDIVDDITHVSFGDSFGDITAYVDEMKTWCEKDVSDDDIDIDTLEKDMLQSFSEYMRDVGYEKISEMRETDIEALCQEYQENDDYVDIIDDIFGDISEIVQQWDCRIFTQENFNPEKYISK